MSLQLQALEGQKDILAKQLATQQNALQRANQLAEAKRKVAAMQAEIDKMQQECASTQTNHEQPPQHPTIGASHQNEVQNIHTNHTCQEHCTIPSAGIYDPSSPLSAALQHTPWPLGVQANTAPQVQWFYGPHSVHHGLRSHHSFGTRQWPHHGKILHHGMRRSSS